MHPHDAPSTNALKRGAGSLRFVLGAQRTSSVLLSVLMLASASPIGLADSVISAESVKLLTAGGFDDQGEWAISSTTGFSQDQAEFTVGMVADSELSFTHARPDNFAEFTAWASSSSTGSNATFGEPDDFYSWSTGPTITMSGYSYSGLHDLIIENVSLVLYFSIPDALNQDEVNVLMQNHGADRLVQSYAKTLGGVDRMTNPLVTPLDEYVEWDWDKVEDTQFTVDYVSVGTDDDSEVRVDAVGLRVKYHQPWYSFENAKALHTAIGIEAPVLDFGPFDGHIAGLAQESCGLTPDGTGEAFWTFEVEVPPQQELGRLHTYGDGNHTISVLSNSADGGFVEQESGELLGNSDSSQLIRIDIEDGCVSGARVDVNDPQLIVTGSIAGKIGGLAASTSYVRFAIGSFLVHSHPMELGEFAFSVPIGIGLPEVGGTLEVGIAARFQWSSNGTAETTVVHIKSMSISGGYHVEWDRNPECLAMDDLHLQEDEGGLIIAMPSRCTDDITAGEALSVAADSTNTSLVDASGEGHNLRIQPNVNSYGSATVNVLVSDERGNSWSDSFIVNIAPVPDPPVIEGLPLTVYIELGETGTIELDISDPDTDSLVISTSRSWATVSPQRVLSLTPVEPGTQTLRLTVSDGTTELSQDIEVIVAAKPDLIVESVEVRYSGVASSSLVRGDVVEIVGFVRNEGRGAAYNVSFHCRVNGVLVGSDSIDSIDPGGLKMVVCDAQLNEASPELTIMVEIDGTASIQETDESNNLLEAIISVEQPSDSSERSNPGNMVIFISVCIILASLVFLHMGPRRVKKDFERRK